MYNIVKTGREFKLAKGGAIARKTGNEIVRKVVEFMEEIALLTLKQLNSQLRALLREKPMFTQQALFRALQGQITTEKLQRTVQQSEIHCRLLMQDTNLLSGS